MKKNESSPEKKIQSVSKKDFSEGLFDLSALEKELRQRQEKLLKTIERIEKSQHVPQELLDLEVSV